MTALSSSEILERLNRLRVGNLVTVVWRLKDTDSWTTWEGTYGGKTKKGHVIRYAETGNKLVACPYEGVSYQRIEPKATPFETESTEDEEEEQGKEETQKDGSKLDGMQTLNLTDPSVFKDSRQWIKFLDTCEVGASTFTILLEFRLKEHYGIIKGVEGHHVDTLITTITQLSQMLIDLPDLAEVERFHNLVTSSVLQLELLRAKHEGNMNALQVSAMGSAIKDLKEPKFVQEMRTRAVEIMKARSALTSPPNHPTNNWRDREQGHRGRGSFRGRGRGNPLPSQ